MKKELPIIIEDAVVVSECWTFEKLAIIQTSKHAEAWLASHFRLYMDNCFCAYFGEWSTHYRPSYYDDILHAKIINIFEVKQEDIVSIIKQNIDNGNYVLLGINMNIQNINQPRFHEVLIYGYNDVKQSFNVPIMNNRIFTKGEISYQYIEKSFPLLIEYYKTNPNFRIDMSIKYQYPFISYSLKDDYSTDQCVYMALDKIQEEFYGKQVTISTLSETMSTYDAPVYYTGLGCMNGLEKVICMYIENKYFTDNFYSLTSILKKMHEHRNMILLSMNYIYKKWEINDLRILEDIQIYETCCERFNKWYLMSLKCEQTSDKLLLYRMLADVNTAYAQERNTLIGYYGQCCKWYEQNNKS
ncbi:MAG: hypothetical protein PHH84_05995 [Oscillospiraceae bacterium]|nr:hypothetical protein [Oscillospiraceae bacterium]